MSGAELRGVVLDSPEPRKLAQFYEQLLGWTIQDDEDTWVTVVPPGGGTKLSFQLEPKYVKPHWPSEADRQQMQLHLDIHVEDVAATERRAVQLGAIVQEWQPQDDVRVLADPDGHVFCLF
jgi:predicted enzyme related to lactoylglutathione lyase